MYYLSVMIIKINRIIHVKSSKSCDRQTTVIYSLFYSLTKFLSFFRCIQKFIVYRVIEIYRGFYLCFPYLDKGSPPLQSLTSIGKIRLALKCHPNSSNDLKSIYKIRFTVKDKVYTTHQIDAPPK